MSHVYRAPALALLALWSGMGCASLPKAPVQPATTAPARVLGLAVDGLAEPRLWPGDALVLETGVGDELQARALVVDARGELHVASGRDVKVSGLSIGDAEARVTEVLRQSDRFIEARLRYAAGVRRQVSVLGAVVRPGVVEFAPAMRVVDVIVAAGGILTHAAAPDAPATSVADLDAAVFVREGRILPISVREAMAGRYEHNIYVRGGDYIYLPFATQNTVAVFGQVYTPRLLPHRSGMRLTEALSAAGGLTVGGDKSDIRLVRGRSAPRVYRASLRSIADGDTSDIVLAAGDVVFVEDDPIEDIDEALFLVLWPLDLLLPLAALFAARTL